MGVEPGSRDPNSNPNDITHPKKSQFSVFYLKKKKKSVRLHDFP